MPPCSARWHALQSQRTLERIVVVNVVCLDHTAATARPADLGPDEFPALDRRVCRLPSPLATALLDVVVLPAGALFLGPGTCGS